MNKISAFNGRPTIAHLERPNLLIEKKYSYFDLVRNCQVLILTLSIGCIWFALAVVAYTLLLGSSNLGGNIYQSYAYSALAEFIPAVTSPYWSNRFGRKKTLLGSLSLAGVLVGCMALVPRSLSFKYYIDVGLMVAAKWFCITAFGVVYTWTFELFPTPLRSQGMSVCIIFERVGIFCVPFITKLLQSVSYKLPFILMCVLGLISSLIGLVLPETYDKPTREKYEDFFDKHPTQSLPHCGLENNPDEIIEEEIDKGINQSINE